jgi:hypothetical protein
MDRTGSKAHDECPSFRPKIQGSGNSVSTHRNEFPSRRDTLVKIAPLLGCIEFWRATPQCESQAGATNGLRLRSVQPSDCSYKCGAVGVPRLATSRATASPYICLAVCCIAIKLLREDSVSRLAGSLASSAQYILSRNPPCFLRRSIVTELGSCTDVILHCTHRPGEKFARKPIRSDLRTHKSLVSRGRLRVAGKGLQYSFPSNA